eukprot:TRINITY_DN57656_c0_g1_i1.p2 TRINITY_DN57656_c0_g1~~TRINITY_DN57656_c0_g1_i1.p2  ORF type:complete len:64 (+),score=3.50 TRINITY_DN57656_c0_g1_i1:68-259(+)
MKLLNSFKKKRNNQKKQNHDLKNSKLVPLFREKRIDPEAESIFAGVVQKKPEGLCIENLYKNK